MGKEVNGTQKALAGKLFIKAILKVETGMHIGGGNDYAPIGAVDSPFVRDTLTRAPIIPGSTMKGKLRTLLAKSTCQGYVLHKVDEDNEIIKRLFGSSGKNMACPARLQFFDMFITKSTEELFGKNLDTDTYIGEVKFENTINRASGIANPRHIERVPAGVKFDFKLVYNIEAIAEIDADIKTLAQGLRLLEADYLGGHGSRGYGRVSFADFSIEKIGGVNVDTDKYLQLLEGSKAI
ncbi:MAG: type III-A CRISPR-associated RAMP protein Csm3 [Phascolarctobacterium sp.]|uniref:type III-A CRISPR-associated RAMP protein Csm3 n=1 Tax=Phascolarctobacterium sp. TaxID=2049039 RepID=UPI0026DD9E7C|nr:type III-A CRISPR-associated RAMP protein Csm3 [Phascolarctobacterium sp.]MDO4921636.1 type III-A CRISPR-associated RAMP protein Csm3 [Phascolarctobacterium sp.]